MKSYKTYYDSELDTWVIDNSNIKKGEFDDNPSVVLQNHAVDKTILKEVLEEYKAHIYHEHYNAILRQLGLEEE
jgi:ABC-type uncharacterized transport system substrate-binding protein